MPHTRFFLYVAFLVAESIVIVPAVNAAEAPGPSRLRPNETYAAIPSYFEKNVGQADDATLFLGRSAGYTLVLTSKGALLSLAHNQITLDFVGASSRAAVASEQRLEGHSNYYIGNDPRRWVRDVPQFGRVRYRGLYPGIDLVWYGNRNQLEYDFLLQPGADPSQVRLRFTGADSLSIAGNGDVVLKGSGSELRQRAPVVWQQHDAERMRVDAGYVLLANGEVGIRLAKYDHSLPLAIDPVLSYSTFLGGSAQTSSTGIAIDSTGNAYVAGYTTASDFPGTSGAGWMFVAKLNPSGTGLVYVTYFGSAAFGDSVFGIAADNAGNAYVTGQTNGASFPATSGAWQTSKSGSGDGFVLKLGLAGEIVWATYLGGSGNDGGEAIAVDSAGNSYIAGFSGSPDFPTTSGSCASDLDVLVAKLNPTGTALQYATCIGGSGADVAYAIALDSQLNVYVAGMAGSWNLPTTQGAYQGSARGNKANALETAFVAKLTSGTLSYLTYLGGSGGEEAHAIAVDSAGNAYVGGWTVSTDFPTTPGALQVAKPSPNDGIGFVTKLNPAGTALIWSTYLGGSDSSSVQAIAADSLGHAYVAGSGSAAAFPPTPGAIFSSGPAACCNNDVFLSELSADGSHLEYSARIGSTASEEGLAMARSSTGMLYISGATNSDNFPTTPAAFQTTRPSQADFNAAFAVKIDMTSPILCNVSLSPTGTAISPAGGSGSFDVSIPTGCPWEAVPDAGITLGATTHAVSAATVTFTVGKSPSAVTARTLHIFVGPETYTITQTPAAGVTLTLRTVGSGTITATPSVVGGKYAIGTQVCLTATAAPGWRFASWSGTPLNASNCLTMNANASVTATFVSVNVTLTLTVWPSGTGTLTATPAAAGNIYLQGTRVCLTAKPASGYYFLAWVGSVELDTRNCFTLNANASEQARFVKGSALTVSIAPRGAGTVSLKPAPTAGTYAPGTKICLTPTAKAGYAFGSWTGWRLDENNCLVMVDNLSVTANFVRAYALTLKASPIGAGTVTALPASPNHYYANGAKVCLTATPKSGYSFGSWSGATLDKGNCFIVKATTTVTARFVKTN